MSTITNINEVLGESPFKLFRTEEWIYLKQNSDIILVALSGVTSLTYIEQGGVILLQKDDTVGIPSSVKRLRVTPISLSSEILELYVKSNNV